MIDAEVLTLEGIKKPKISLPAKIFGAEPNSKLMAQAVRVFLSNQRRARAKTKTRGEVNRSKAKWYRQKGTGRARHGARSAPLFVGGGRAHGPTGEENYKKVMPQKMRRAALVSALSAKARDKEIIVLEGIEKIKKTKEMAELIKDLKLNAIKKNKTKLNILIVLPRLLENVILATRNIEGIKLIPVDSLNTYEVLKARKVLIAKEAIKILEERWGKD